MIASRVGWWIDGTFLGWLGKKCNACPHASHGMYRCGLCKCAGPRGGRSQEKQSDV